MLSAFAGNNSHHRLHRLIVATGFGDHDMLIGVPKEIKAQEFRVGMTPASNAFTVPFVPTGMNAGV